jgi:hypothetical protein
VALEDIMENSSITAISDVIRLSVAPVFLLAGIGGMLSVMTNRLGRTVDRARVLTERTTFSEEDRPIVDMELSALSRRLRLINYSITLCILTACAISAVIIALFVGAFLRVNTATAVAIFFIVGMLTLLLGLLTFLREIFLAGTSFRAWEHARMPQPPSTRSSDKV